MNTHTIAKVLSLATTALLSLSACVSSRQNRGENYQVVHLPESLLDSIRTVPFDKVVVSSAVELNISRGDQPSIEVHSPDAHTMQYFRIHIQGGELRLSMDKAKPNNWTLTKGTASMIVNLQLPRLSVLDARGACEVELRGGFEGKELGIALSGASDLKVEDRLNYQAMLCHLSGASEVEIDQLQAGELVLIAEGASEASLQGKCDKLTSMILGASDADLNELEVQSASVEVQGASTLDLWVSKLLNYRVNGASSLKYRGTAELGTTSCQGASKVRKR